MSIWKRDFGKYNFLEFFSQAKFKRRTFHEPNSMQMNLDKRLP